MIILYAGVLSSGLALPMWNFGVRHTGAAQAAIIQNLIRSSPFWQRGWDEASRRPSRKS